MLPKVFVHFVAVTRRGRYGPCRALGYSWGTLWTRPASDSLNSTKTDAPWLLQNVRKILDSTETAEALAQAGQGLIMKASTLAAKLKQGPS